MAWRHKVQAAPEEDPFSCHVFAFRSRRRNVIKVLWSTGVGLCLLAKRLERRRFVWPQADSGKVHLTAAQPLALVIDGASRHDIKLVKATLADLKLRRP